MGGGTIQKYIRVNQRIRVREIRLIGPKGEQLGILPTAKGLQLAEEQGLDLVEVAAGAKPPVCRVMDFSKYKYDQERQERQAKKKQRQSRLKEIRVKPKIGEHDYQVKLRHTVEFLKKRDRVKVSLFFRGREMAHREFGRKILDKFIADTASVGQIEKGPSQEGRIMTMTIIPK
ncbi:MAG: translation initiation factor IF-3 [Candidatus Omnitrophota bacterium]